jgi:hypothetical protein
VLVNVKVKEKKFEVHHTWEPELADPPPYVPLVHPTAQVSLRPESDSEDSNGKEEALDLNPHSCHQAAPLLYPSPTFFFSGPRERYETLGKVTELWRLTSKEAQL